MVTIQTKLEYNEKIPKKKVKWVGKGKDRHKEIVKTTTARFIGVKNELDITLTVKGEVDELEEFLAQLKIKLEDDLKITFEGM
jgi:hypothetical protein